MRERLDDSSGQNNEIEPSLERLQPRASSVSRDRLMFLAGHEAALREPADSRRWRWPLATAASWLVTAAVAGVWMQSEHQSQLAPVALDDQMPREAVSPSEAESEPVEHHKAEVAQHQTLPSVPARDQSAGQLGSLVSVEALLDGDDQPRLSMVGWRSWDRANQSLDDIHVDADREVVEVPPASYSRLMKFYLDNPAASEIQGDLL